LISTPRLETRAAGVRDGTGARQLRLGGEAGSAVWRSPGAVVTIDVAIRDRSTPGGQLTSHIDVR
jgi:hypothetical protein